MAEIEDLEIDDACVIDEEAPVLEAEENLVKWAAKVLEQETSEEMHKIKMQILRRIASESDIKPARIPAPMNITEIGGYFNLMMRLKKEEEKQQQKILTQKKQDTSSDLLRELSQRLVLSQNQERILSDMLTQTLTSTLGLPMQTPNGE